MLRAMPAGRAPLVRLRHYIGGRFVDAAGGGELADIEPATGRAWASLPDGDARDVDRAVAAAREAFPGWASLPAAERSRWLWRIADEIERRAESLAQDESTDTGKPLALARRVDIPRAVRNFRFFASAILHQRAEAYDTDGFALNYTLRQPRGVGACISPWNLPLYLLSWKVAPALATGNTVVAKPSELAPVTAHRLAEICDAVGLPPGVLNIVHGTGPRAGAALVAHPEVPTITFTGGSATGAAIAAAAAPRFKRLALELGGKNPTVVFADADLERACAESVRAAFANQGEMCLCGSRVLVERSLYEAFVERFVARARRLVVGDPREPDTDLGALISAAHRDKVAGYVALAREEGAEVLAGGGVPRALPERCRDGFFFEPTVLAGLGAACRANQEEIFGPVASLMPFDDEEEAVSLANATPYGLCATVWTENLARAHRVAAKLEAGTVWVNCWLLRDLRTPFGGVKQSGVGREGGEEALRFFTEPKTVCIRHGGEDWAG